MFGQLQQTEELYGKHAVSHAVTRGQAVVKTVKEKRIGRGACAADMRVAIFATLFEGGSTTLCVLTVSVCARSVISSWIASTPQRRFDDTPCAASLLQCTCMVLTLLSVLSCAGRNALATLQAALYAQAADFNKTARFYYMKAQDAYYLANAQASYDDWRRARRQWDYFYRRK
jgi:hypothetical protein